MAPKNQTTVTQCCRACISRLFGSYEEGVPPPNIWSCACCWGCILLHPKPSTHLCCGCGRMISIQSRPPHPLLCIACDSHCCCCSGTRLKVCLAKVIAILSCAELIMLNGTRWLLMAMHSFPKRIVPTLTASAYHSCHTRCSFQLR